MSIQSNKNHNARRRKLELGWHTREQLDRIYLRDKGICWLCHEPCTREDASRDHIKEIAYCTKQEARSDKNIRLAHKECNHERSADIERRISAIRSKYMRR